MVGGEQFTPCAGDAHSTNPAAGGRRSRSRRHAADSSRRVNSPPAVWPAKAAPGRQVAGFRPVLEGGSRRRRRPVDISLNSNAHRLEEAVPAGSSAMRSEPAEPRTLTMRWRERSPVHRGDGFAAERAARRIPPRTAWCPGRRPWAHSEARTTDSERGKQRYSSGTRRKPANAVATP